MAQHDYVIDNSTGANVRADINSVLQAIASNNSGSSAPSTTIALQFYADTTNNILKLRNAANDGFINLFTLAGGVDVDAASNFNEDVTFTGASANILFDKSLNQFQFLDNAKAEFGTGGDLEIFHDGSNSHIAENGTGSLLIKSDAINLGSISGEFYFRGFENGAASLRFDNSEKLVTAADRINIDGHLFINGGNSLYIQNGFTDSSSRIRNSGGSNDSNLEFLIKESGTELEALEITNTGHIRIPNDSKRLKIGAGDDIQIYHDGSESYVKNTNVNSNLILEGAHGVDIKHGGEDMAKFRPDDAVQLYSDNVLRFKTNSSGAEVSGNNGNIFTASCATNSTASVLFSNTEANSSGDMRLLIKVAANQGSDPYIKFDAGGSDMIVGTRYVGTTNNFLVLGAGNDPSSVAGINVLGTGIVDLTHTYANAVGGSIRDLFIRSDGRLGYDSSVRASKTNINDLTDISWIDKLSPKTFNKFKQDNAGAFTSENYTNLEYGLIAEEVETVNKELCSYSNDGKLETVYYRMLITPLLKGLQDARKAITSLETKVAALESA